MIHWIGVSSILSEGPLNGHELWSKLKSKHPKKLLSLDHLVSTVPASVHFGLGSAYSLSSSVCLFEWCYLRVLPKEAPPASLLPSGFDSLATQAWGAVSYRLACLQGALVPSPHNYLVFIALFYIPWLVAFKLSCAPRHPLLCLPFHHSFLYFISPFFLLPASFSFPLYFLFVHHGEHCCLRYLHIWWGFSQADTSQPCRQVMWRRTVRTGTTWWCDRLTGTQKTGGRLIGMV